MNNDKYEPKYCMNCALQFICKYVEKAIKQKIEWYSLENILIVEKTMEGIGRRFNELKMLKEFLIFSPRNYPISSEYYFWDADSICYDFLPIGQTEENLIANDISHKTNFWKMRQRLRTHFDSQ